MSGLREEFETQYCIDSMRTRILAWLWSLDWTEVNPQDKVACLMRATRQGRQDNMTFFKLLGT